MHCHEVAQQLSALLDGELSASAEEAVTRHIDSCGHCAVQHEQLKQVDRLFHQTKLPEHRLPRLTDRIMASVSGPEKDSYPRAKPMSRDKSGLFSPERRWGTFVRAAAVILFACLVLTPFWIGSPRETDAVANIMKETEVLLADISRTFSTAGWAVAAAPQDMANNVKGVWLAMAGDTAENRLSEALEQTQAAIPDGVDAVSGYLGQFLTRFSRLE